MKRLLFIMLISLTVNMVNAQYCHICGDSDEDVIIGWKTWKHCNYQFKIYEKNKQMYHGDYRLGTSLSQCQHNKFSYLKLSVYEIVDDPVYDGIKDVLELNCSPYSNKNFDSNFKIRRLGIYTLVEYKEYTFYIPRSKYPNAFEEMDEIYRKAVDAGLLKHIKQ